MAKAIFVYLVSPMIWTTIFVGAAILLSKFWPTVNHYLYNSAGFFFGQWFGIIGALIKSITKSGRQDLREDFLSVIAKYQR
jgi:hypothetical protein